jgi:hypothetical protein
MLMHKPIRNVGPVTFETLGLVDLQIAIGGKKVKVFSKLLLARVELNETSIISNTGKPLQLGDSLPIWSQDETTGKWTLEGKETVKIDLSTGIVYRYANHSPFTMEYRLVLVLLVVVVEKLECLQYAKRYH